MNIVIIGGSVAANTAAIHLRQKNKDCRVTLISEEAYPFYDRRKLFDYWAGKIKEKELFLSNTDFYAQQNITFLKESKAVALNPSRRTVSYKTGEKRQSIDYDYAVIATGTRTPSPDINGINKTGVFRFDSLSDFKELKSAVTQDAVCLIGTNRLTSAVIAALGEKKVEVKLITDRPIEAQGPHVEVIQSEIADIIGESGVQAIKLKEGKIIGVSWAAIMTPAVPNVDFLQDSAIELNNGAIAVDGAMRTSLDRIFACGSVCLRRNEAPKIKTWDETINESLAVVENLLNV